MARDRLPCPDVDGDGLEDCNVLAARPLGGGFPFRTLGWVEWPPAPSESRFRYAVYRGEVDLAVAGARSDPVWPPGVPAGLQRRGAVQFCEALHALSRASGPALQVRSGTPAQAPVAVAFALSGVDPSAGAIDGRLEGGGFGPDGSDSRLLPFGFLELGDQLGCREVLSSVLPAMREAALAHALWRAAASRVPAHEAPAAAAAYRDAALRQALLREDRAWLQ